MNFLTALAAFAVAIGILVVVHELGHYLVARWCKVKILKFSIGFGKPLLVWKSPKTGTEWTLSALPLGGFVKMLDERETESPVAAADLPYAFNRQRRVSIGACVSSSPRGAGGIERPLVLDRLPGVVLLAVDGERMESLEDPPDDGHPAIGS